MKPKPITNKSQKLSELDLLVLDCQATGPNPEKNALLELGWARINPKNRSKIRVSCFLVRTTEEVTIPGAVSRVTGLKPEDFERAHRDEKVWKKLMRSARRVVRSNDMDACPLVIHFARFEKPYLESLNRKFGHNDAFPFSIICTHQIARRLLTTLPRKGIRAVAGYLGYGVGELRRSAHHVLATAHIWRTMVPILRSEHNITTFPELVDWLAETSAPPSANIRAYPMPADQRKALPDKPGVYRMLRESGDVLYVGKATSLKRRVNSYFQKRTGHAEHILEMLSQAREIDFTPTETALEAALLENKEIKKHRPPYNKALRRRERALHFFSADLSVSSGRAGRKFVIGPVPNPRIMNAAFNLETFLSPRSTRPKELTEEFFGFPMDETPGEDCILAGISIFWERFDFDREGGLSIRDLFSMGRRSFGRRRDERALLKDQAESPVDPDTDESEPDEEPADWVWTPEAVAGLIESILRGAYHQIRRARFFCWLSESSLTWQLKDRQEFRHLMIRDGNVHSAHTLQDQTPAVYPVGFRKNPSARRRTFDIERYDQMRVYSTELRRLVSEERPLLLRVTRGGVLDTASLKRVFRWL